METTDKKYRKKSSFTGKRSLKNKKSSKKSLESETVNTISSSGDTSEMMRILNSETGTATANSFMGRRSSDYSLSNLAQLNNY